MNKKSKLIIKFDKEKDLRNIWKTCNSKSSYGNSWKESVTKNILKICHGKEYKKMQERIA